tara:strand:- start:140441 stop:141523 length:1083 start_codon:yes stop_codon:yes gene_type:complete
MIKAIDFFCGIGGVTAGFIDAGIDVVAGIDKDPDCKVTYEYNHKRLNSDKSVPYLLQDISDSEFCLSRDEFDIKNDDILVVIGCAPCQPFTRITDVSEKRKKERSLLSIFAEKVRNLNPDYIFVENVTGLRSNMNGNNEVLNSFISDLNEQGYVLNINVVNAAHYGVPQNRKRLIIFGKKGEKIEFPEETHGRKKQRKKPLVKLRDVIEDLPPVEAGLKHDNIPNHISAKLKDISLERLSYQENPGEGMETWPEHLQLPSRRKAYSGHNDVYARLNWDKPSSTLTTKFFSISNGRFAHPVQNRALTIREGLRIQTFDSEKREFVLIDERVSIMSRQIGNAVPVKMAEAFANKIIEDINDL